MLSKSEIINQIEEHLSRCTIAILTDYRGLSVVEMSQLRRKLQESDADYRVVKNTLTHLAAERVGKKDLDKLLQGPTAITFGYGNATELAKSLLAYIRASKSTLGIKGAMLGNHILTSREVTELSLLPPREILLSKLMQEMQAPISSLVFLLGSSLRGFLGVLEARKSQLEGGN